MLDRSVIRKPKCFCCIPVETGCFIYGVFNAVGSGMAILALCFLMNNVLDSLRELGDDGLDKKSAVAFITNYSTIVAMYLSSMLTFIFSVFLCYGVQKRRAGFVKAYLVYGIVKTILLMLGAIVYSSITGDMMGGSLILMGCGIFSLMLLMVHRTFELFQTEALLIEAQPLENKPCMKA